MILTTEVTSANHVMFIACAQHQTTMKISYHRVFCLPPTAFFVAIVLFTSPGNMENRFACLMRTSLPGPYCTLYLLQILGNPLPRIKIMRRKLPVNIALEHLSQSILQNIIFALVI